MLVKVSLRSLHEGRWYEYLIRFGLGGAATVFTGFISSSLGPSIGGLFLALPAIFCASATLIEKHEIRKKREAGLQGERRGEVAAALDAAGAALGSTGLLSFAAIFLVLADRNCWWALAAACAAWLLTSVGAWRIWRRTGVARK